MIELAAGEQYGRFTIVGEAPRNRFGARQYRCRCECGNEADYPVSIIIGKPNRHCRKCVPHSGGLPKPNLTGKQMNGWDVLEEAGCNDYGALLFKCRCLRCGTVTLKTAMQIRMRKTDRCDNCPPSYNFQIANGVATGTLPNGIKFIIDEEDIPLVEQYNWQDDHADGYIVSKNPRVRLHRFIAGVDDPKVMVDHINRDRRDCRKTNLRVISPFGNSCNHGLFCTNKTGYTGVYYSNCDARYVVRVGYDHKRIFLGSTRNENELVTLAQMYNIGAKFFFGEYAGALNDVPDPPEEMVKSITAKCQKYLKPSQTGAASVA